MGQTRAVVVADHSGVVQGMSPDYTPAKRIHYRGVPANSSTGYAKSSNGSIAVDDDLYAAWETHTRTSVHHPNKLEVEAFVFAFKRGKAAVPTTIRKAREEARAEAQKEVAAVMVAVGAPPPQPGQTIDAYLTSVVAALTAPAPTPEPATAPTLADLPVADLLAEINRRIETATTAIIDRRRDAAVHAAEVEALNRRIAELNASAEADRADAQKFRQARQLFGS